MNKKVNTILFILGATLFNVITAIISFVLFTLFYVRFIMPLIPESGGSWGFILIFLASLAVSFLVYRFVLRYLLTKVKIEDYFDPIFVSKYKKKPNVD
jgi:phosphoglycerol transferase MdoB-like AlkP superfamily enzyme